MKQTKHYRRILAAVLAAVLTVAMSLTAFATSTQPSSSTDADNKDKGKITISNPQENVTYYAFQIFDVSYTKTADEQAHEKGSFSYSIAGNSDFLTAVKSYTDGAETNGVISGKGLTLTKAAGSDAYVVTVNTKAPGDVFNAANFANDMKAVVAGTDGLKTGMSDKAKAFAGPQTDKTGDVLDPLVIGGSMPLGYYLVVGVKSVTGEDGATTTSTEVLCELNTTDPEVTIRDKNDTPFGKEVTGVKDPGAANPTVIDPTTGKSVSVGQTLTYTITGSMPDRSGAEKYVYLASDMMSKGLAFNKDVTVNIGGTANADGTITGGTVVTLTPETGDITGSTTGNKIHYNDAVTTGDNQNGGGFVLCLDLLKKNGTDFEYADDAKIYITYTATVTEESVTDISKNEATLQYGNDPGSLVDTTPAIVTTYSSKLEVTKYTNDDGEKGPEDPNSKKLPGAKFVLRRKGKTASTTEYYAAKNAAGTVITSKAADGTDLNPTASTTVGSLAEVTWVPTTDTDGKAVLPTDYSAVTVLTTDADGKVTFAGMENGIYELVEIEAPAGYNLLDQPKKVEIFMVIDRTAATFTLKSGEIDAGDKTAANGWVSGDDGMTLDTYSSQTVEAAVLNKSGSLLPSTGGIGTTIFYVLGSVLLVLAAAWFVISRRRTQTEEK